MNNASIGTFGSNPGDGQIKFIRKLVEQSKRWKDETKATKS